MSKNVLLAAVAIIAVSVALMGESPVRASDDDNGAPSANGDASPPAKNIFTPPESESHQLPSYNDNLPPRERFLRGNNGEKKGIPDFRTIRTIPSLTPQQRKEIRQVYEKAKLRSQPITQQLEAMRDKHQGDMQKAMGDPEEREKLVDLRHQLQTLRLSTWDSVKTILTESQVQELDSMRHGELPAATFNRPTAPMQPSKMSNE